MGVWSSTVSMCVEKFSWFDLGFFVCVLLVVFVSGWVLGWVRRGFSALSVLLKVTFYVAKCDVQRYYAYIVCFFWSCGCWW